jgi:hypothetical protein
MAGETAAPAHHRAIAASMSSGAVVRAAAYPPGKRDAGAVPTRLEPATQLANDRRKWLADDLVATMDCGPDAEGIALVPRSLPCMTGA